MQTDPRTVIITGASSGIGLALVEAYLERGFNVVGNARSSERLEQAAANFSSPERFLGVAGDIGAPATAKNLFERAIAQFGQVDVLVNNAGIFIAKPMVEYITSDLESLIDTNLKGFFYASQQAAVHMIPRRQGHIINITASLALQPTTDMPALLPVLVKGGINQATRALALELAAHNIQVTAVAPGLIDTPLLAGVDRDFLNTQQPAGRIGSTRDIVDAVLYLSDARFTSGIVLPVDGAMSAGKW